MRLLIKQGHVLDPGRIDGIHDILVENGKIREISTVPIPETAADRVLPAEGKLITPGLIDIHVHLREPGHEYKETVATGLKAAAAGGFTAVCAMPNTNPTADCPEIISFILKQAEAAGPLRVFPVAAVTPGLGGKSLTEFGALKEAGAAALSDDGRPVENARLMRRAMEYARCFGLVMISHSEELALSGDGCMNEGETATRMGLKGIPNAAESVAVMREIALCELTGCPLHIAHVSTRQSVDAVRGAKARGLPVTAETAPHYFTLTDKAVEGYNTHAKMSPPLRGEADRKAVRQGLADGTLDIIATDHAPHSEMEKAVEFDKAANGIIGLETSLPLSLSLVRDGILSLSRLVERMSIAPAALLGIDNRLTAGNRADLTVIDPDLEWTVDADRFHSKSRNTPFNGWTLRGTALWTIAAGQVIHGHPHAPGHASHIR
ncbi:MAG: dihydroorotase [Desulfobacterales bacterium]|nr:MAG: dihydroorotase [Desulfobacterales bacterium]